MSKRRRKKKWSSRVRRVGLFGLAVLAGMLAAGWVAGFGCAGGWRPAVNGAPAVSADLMAGEWLGTWASNQSAMQGELRCRIEKQEEGVYLAHFDAVVAKLLTNRTSTLLRVQRTGESWEFSGEQDLGLLKGGVYKYQGQSDGTDFVCSYDSSFDKGTFRMKRIGTATETAGK